MADDIKPVKIKIVIETEGLPKPDEIVARTEKSTAGGKPPEPGKKEREEEIAEETKERKPRRPPRTPQGHGDTPQRRPGGARPAASGGGALSAAVKTIIIAEIIKAAAPVVAGIVEETARQLVGEKIGKVVGDTVGDQLVAASARISAIENSLLASLGASRDAGSVALAQKALLGEVNAEGVLAVAGQRLGVLSAEAGIETERSVTGRRLAGQAGVAATASLFEKFGLSR